MMYPSCDGSVSRQCVVRALARLRAEWQATDTDSLVDASASVGLLMADLAVALGLNQEELREALGEALFRELFDVLQYA